MAFPSRGLAISIAMHGAVLLAMILQWPQSPDTETSPVPAPVSVSLAAMGGAPAAAPAAAIRQKVSATDAVETGETTEPESIEAVGALPESVAEPAPIEAIPAEPADVATVSPPEAPPATEPPPEVVKPEEQPETTKAEEPQPQPKKQEPEPEPKAPASSADAAPPQPQASAAAPAVSAATGANAASAGNAAVTASASSGMVNYSAALQAWLQDHMRYPRKAKLRGMEGTATLWLSIDPDGKVLSFRIEQSSGHSLLDTEVEALVHRADPMPAVPENMRAASIEFVVPVQFVLK